MTRIFTSKYTWLFVILIISASMLMLGVQQNIFKMDCDFLACKYQEKIMPFFDIFGFIVFLPVFLFIYLRWTHPLLLLLSHFLSTVYLYLVFLILGLLIRLLFRIKKENRNLISSELNNNRLRSNLMVIIIFASFMAYISFLYYPLLNLDIKFDQFLLIATAIVALSAFILNFYKGKNAEAVILRKSIKKLTELSVSFLILGSFINFMLAKMLPISTITFFNQAIIDSLQKGLFSGGLLGLSLILLTLIQYNSDKGISN